MKMTTGRLALALALAAAPLAAQQPPQPPQQPPGGMGPRMGAMMGMAGGGMLMGMGYAPQRLVDRREALGLTPDQVSRLETLAQQAKQARDKADSVAKAHRDALADLWKQDAPDVNQVRTHAQAAMQAMESAHLAQLVAAAQAKAVLTPEQRGRVAGWGDAARMRMRQFMNRPGRMGGARRMPMQGPMRMRRGPGSI
jgi:Spy/CpxP family protein refolding chaperone